MRSMKQAGKSSGRYGDLRALNARKQKSFFGPFVGLLAAGMIVATAYHEYKRPEREAEILQRELVTTNICETQSKRMFDVKDGKIEIDGKTIEIVELVGEDRFRLVTDGLKQNVELFEQFSFDGKQFILTRKDGQKKLCEM